MPNITINHTITYTNLIPLEIIASAAAQEGREMGVFRNPRNPPLATSLNVHNISQLFG